MSYEGVHTLSSDDKLKHFGYGEWVEEPDEINFIHAGIKCEVHRVKHEEHEGSWFGGHLIGYVLLPPNHPWLELDLQNMTLQVHGGISEVEKCKEGVWVGFECDKYNDAVPSMLMLRKQVPFLGMLREAMNEEQTYRNINYAVQECKNLIEECMRDWKEDLRYFIRLIDDFEKNEKELIRQPVNLITENDREQSLEWAFA